MMIFKTLVILLLSFGVANAQQPLQTRACDADHVVTGGTPVVALTGPFNGGFIVNPLLSADQGGGSVEPLNLNLVGTAAAAGSINGTTFALPAGSTFNLPSGGLSASISVNATTSGHKFTCTRW